MKRIDEGAEQTAQSLRERHPHLGGAAKVFGLALQRQGVLQAWTGLLGQANRAPSVEADPHTALRDGLAGWFADRGGAPSADPRQILTWLIHDQTPQQLDLLRARMLPVLQHLIAPAAHTTKDQP